MDEVDEGMAYETGQSEPTQSLLTALGRFQRQVAKAQAGARQDEWSDECMNHLIGAVEIAIEHDWVDLVEALTDTARLLHSYEDSNRANRCLPFLADSYELLCLMVGDLIVDNVRPVVMEKWRRRYESAIDDMKAEGLRLIQDDEDDDAEDAPIPVAAASVSGDDRGIAPREASDPMPFADVSSQEPRDPDALEDDLPALDELPPLQGVERVGVESVSAGHLDYEEELHPIEPMSIDDADALPEMPMIGNVGYLPTDPEPSMAHVAAAPRMAEPKRPPAPIEVVEEIPMEASPHTFEELESGFDAVEAAAESDDAVDDDTMEADSEEPEEEDAREELYRLDGPPSRRDLEPAVVQHLDALCEDLARLERGEELDPALVLATIDARIDSLRIHAHSSRRPRAETLCGVISGLCLRAQGDPRILTDKFFELAYGFCGLYADADAGEDDAAESAWIEETTSLGAGDTDSNPDYSCERVVEDAPFEQALGAAESLAATDADLDRADEVAQESPAPERTPVEMDVPDHAVPEQADPAAVAEALLALLNGAQHAAAHGDIAHAKTLALQAAVRIAETEVEQAEGQLASTERYLESNRTALEEAHVGATAAEAGVGECETQIADGEAALAEARQRIGQTHERLSGVEQRIAEIEEQIRALQAERDAEAQRAEEIRAALEHEHATEQAGVTELEQRRVDEVQARKRLDEARRRIETLERQREEGRANRSRAEAGLDEKRQSLAELEHTVELIQSRLGVEPR